MFVAFGSVVYWKVRAFKNCTLEHTWLIAQILLQFTNYDNYELVH